MSQPEATAPKDEKTPTRDSKDAAAVACIAPLADAFARVRRGTRVASICTGAFVLASAGLLDGQVATTHWRFAEQFATLFPQVELDPDVLYTDSGDVLTSAGCASGIDLCLHMIRRDFGMAVANDVARRTVVVPHRDGGQVQYVRRPVPEPSSPSTAAARGWALQRLHEPITLGQMAAQEAMSVGHFNRRFREEAGTTPMNWLLQQRVERARELLEESDLPVEKVAERAGLGTAANLRQHFQAVLGTSPSAYRSTFRGPGAAT
ncbi:helix-turn-helix domain-containing protein [Streptomyces sp. NPDC001020]